jgi:hypothetical protein
MVQDAHELLPEYGLCLLENFAYYSCKALNYKGLILSFIYHLLMKFAVFI